MRTIYISYPLSELTTGLSGRGRALAIGHFDGVHKGHQQVIGQAVEEARARGLEAAVMTFHPHPKEVLGQGEQYVTYLTPLPDKLAYFASLGVETVYVMAFNLALAQVAPACFVQEVLRPLQVRCAVVGFDFTFGHKGAGTPQLLRELGAPTLDVVVAEPFHLDGRKVSSTEVRALLAGGDLVGAAYFLGRRYEMKGTVVSGDKRGRTIGFPTANIQLAARYVLPPNGVYAVELQCEGSWLRGVMNLGRKPTFHDALQAPVPEVHLFDFTGDLYDQEVSVRLLQFIRAERKFASVDELVAQIGQDLAAARSCWNIQAN